jgi:uncharacterized protein
MSSLAVLLDLQNNDTSTDQLRHRRATLPERQQLADAERTAAALEQEMSVVAAQRHDIARDQKRLEDEIASLESRAAAEDRKLYSGTVTAVKELQALQEEVSSLQRRTSGLEDQVLELMEQAEPLDAQLEVFGRRRDELEARAADARQRLGTNLASIDAELGALSAQRASLAAAVAEPILAEYEQIRARLGGVAAAKLEGGSCRGCHLHLSAVELDRIRKLPADALVHCEECGRILVR